MYSLKRIVLPLIAYTLILFLLVPKLLVKGDQELISPIEITYYDSINTEGILLKDETVYYLNTNKNILDYNEGTKVAFGTVNAGLVPNGINSEIAIKAKKIEDLLAFYDTNTIDIDQDLRKYIIDENYKDAKFIIQNFDLKYIRNLTESEINQKRIELSNLKSSMTSETSKISPNKAGIISYQIDGFENYNSGSIYAFDKGKFDEILKMPTLSGQDNMFKIVDNFKVVFSFHIDDNKKIIDQNGRRVKISFDNYKTFYNGKLLVPDNYVNNGLAGVEITDYIEDIYNLRKTNAAIIFDQKPGLQAPKSSLIKYENKDGVCVRDVNGIVRFRPVEILDSDNVYYIISSGDSQGNITIDDKSVKTATFYEQVLVNPSEKNIGKIFR